MHNLKQLLYLSTFFESKARFFRYVMSGISEKILVTLEDFDDFSKTSKLCRKCSEDLRAPPELVKKDNFGMF